MLDPERAVAVLAALRATGIGMSVDDFGTGNASIEYLAALPATECSVGVQPTGVGRRDRRASLG